MSFSTMLEMLKEKNKEKIVLVKLGPFYTTTGSDAVFLSKQLGLKCICYKKEICKVGIPEARIEYYTEKLARLDIAYIVYDFNSKEEELTEKCKSEGRYHNEIAQNKNCLVCQGLRAYKKEDKYMKAMRKFLEKGSENE